VSAVLVCGFCFAGVAGDLIGAGNLKVGQRSEQAIADKSGAVEKVPKLDRRSRTILLG
jgi:hypothetical protein